jgi:hypothetical protein
MWQKDELRKIAQSDDLHISPSVTTERPTAPRPGFGRSLSMMRFMCAPITAGRRAGIRR